MRQMTARSLFSLMRGQLFGTVQKVLFACFVPLVVRVISFALDTGFVCHVGVAHSQRLIETFSGVAVEVVRPQFALGHCDAYVKLGTI